MPEIANIASKQSNKSKEEEDKKSNDNEALL